MILVVFYSLFMKKLQKNRAGLYIRLRHNMKIDFFDENISEMIPRLIFVVKRVGLRSNFMVSFV